MKIAIIGTGAYSLAMSNVLSSAKNEIRIWSHDQDIVDEYNKTKALKSILPDVVLSDNLFLSTSYKEVIENADVIFIMVAAQFLDNIAHELNKYYKKNQHVIIASKGIEIDTCLFADEIISKSINTKKLAVISGPSFAIDMARLEPVGLAVASKNKKTLEFMINLFKNTTVKLRPTNDVLGIEICGSIKNVIAIATGIVSGLGCSESTQVFLINESLHDIKVLIKDMGGNPKTILSFAGVGDLLLTCTSVKSRNFSFGSILGSKGCEDAKLYLKNTTVEGYYTIKSIYNLIHKKNVSIPIIDLIYKIVIKDENPNTLLEFLLTKQ